jgi:hypothetical protein
MNSYYFDKYKKNTLIDIGIFLEQAYNLSSLNIQSSLDTYTICHTTENVYSIIPRTLKHLQIQIYDLDQIKMILERCENLSTIEFDIENSRFSDKIIKWFTDNTTNSTCWKGHRTITVWLGKKRTQSPDIRLDNKRIKLTDNSAGCELV